MPISDEIVACTTYLKSILVITILPPPQRLLCLFNGSATVNWQKHEPKRGNDFLLVGSLKLIAVQLATEDATGDGRRAGGEHNGNGKVV